MLRGCDLAMSGSDHLLIAATLSFIASLFHVGIIIGGPAWYRFFGAGERFATLAEQGSARPTLITLGIATMLFVWGLYALSGAGVIVRLPLLQPALMAITFVYLARGVLGLVLPFTTNHPAIAENSVTFWMISSVICCAFGLFYLLGTLNSWASLAG